MTCTAWLIAMITLCLPPEYMPVGNKSERVERRGPPGLYATEEFRSWRTPEGKAVVLFYWVPTAPRDLGPMVAARRHPAVVAGQTTEILETSLFMGREQRVLVTHLRFADPESRAMIYADGLTVAEFEALLASLALKRP